MRTPQEQTPSELLADAIARAQKLIAQIELERGHAALRIAFAMRGNRSRGWEVN